MALNPRKPANILSYVIYREISTFVFVGETNETTNIGFLYDRKIRLERTSNYLYNFVIDSIKIFIQTADID